MLDLLLVLVLLFVLDLLHILAQPRVLALLRLPLLVLPKVDDGRGIAREWVVVEVQSLSCVVSFMISLVISS